MRKISWRRSPAGRSLGLERAHCSKWRTPPRETFIGDNNFFSGKTNQMLTSSIATTGKHAH